MTLSPGVEGVNCPFVSKSVSAIEPVPSGLNVFVRWRLGNWADEPKLARAYHDRMAATHLEPVDPVDEELAELLRDPEVRTRLEEFERRRAGDHLGRGVSHIEARRIAGLPAPPDGDPRL